MGDPKIADRLLAWERAPRHEQADAFIKILDLDEFDMAWPASTWDLMIDRTIKRADATKTMKQSTADSNEADRSLGDKESAARAGRRALQRS